MIILDGLNSIPELGFGSDLVGSPKLHPINLGMLIRFRRKSPPHDLVLMKLLSVKAREKTNEKQIKIMQIHFQMD